MRRMPVWPKCYKSEKPTDMFVCSLVSSVSSFGSVRRSLLLNICIHSSRFSSILPRHVHEPECVYIIQ